MKEDLFILMGPTAVGKTEISIELAKRLNSEIISADSMQIYKYMDIGTAKVSESEMEDIPHYLIDIIKPDIEYTVSNYQKDASKYITEIHNRNKLAMVVGGTGFYINSLIYDLNFTRVPPNDKIRNKYELLAEKYGNKYIHDRLKKIDEKSSKKIHLADRRRIIRALEVYEVTGKTMSEYNKDFRRDNNRYNLAMVCLNMDRKSLYDRINKRVDRMVDNGLIEEVKRILDLGYNKDSIALQGIGYKEIIHYLEGDTTLDYAINKIKQGSRNYAKRQLTWFRRDKRIKWVNKDDFDSTDSLVSYITDYVNQTLDL